MAELIIYFFEPDTSTTREDDYVLKRKVNTADPEVLSRNLLKQGSTPFFRYFRKRTTRVKVRSWTASPTGTCRCSTPRSCTGPRRIPRTAPGRTAFVRCA